MKKVAVIGLGYVGLNLAVALSKVHHVIGYDVSRTRIEELKNHWDKNGLVETSVLKNSPIHYADDAALLKDAIFYIVVVSTPIYANNLPNLEALSSATHTVAQVLKKGDVVVFESTVYPGTTEEVCLPILESSGLKSSLDFGLGYSPERISPGEKDKDVKHITKIISAQDEKTLKEVEALYHSICDHLFPVSTIATAEATKLLENIQRDVNIALMNEFTQAMHAFNIKMHEVIAGAQTKWSFVPFKPGFVGGHCIAVDPQYLIYRAGQEGLELKLMSMARTVNESMPDYVIGQIKRLLLQAKKDISKARIGVFGLTYKENVLDFRNSLALVLVEKLKQAGAIVLTHDPLLDKETAQKKYNLQLNELEEMQELTLAIVVVGHDDYKKAGVGFFIPMLQSPKVLIDLPNLFVDCKETTKELVYWCL